MALVTTFVAVIAACSIIGMILVIDATNILTQTAVNTDVYYSASDEVCDAYDMPTCG